jgi:hypothetical protein
VGEGSDDYPVELRVVGVNVDIQPPGVRHKPHVARLSFWIVDPRGEL